MKTDYRLMHRRDRRNIYLRLRLPSGQRLIKSTATDDPEKAQRIAELFVIHFDRRAQDGQLLILSPAKRR